MTERSVRATVGETGSATEETRRVVIEFVDAWTTGDIDRLTTLLAEDVEWRVPESIGGVRNGRVTVANQLAGGVAGKMVRVETMRRDVHHLLVDGHDAMALVRFSAVAHSGVEYVNEYAWHYKVVDGQVRQIGEYADTLRAARLGFLPFVNPEEAGGGQSDPEGLTPGAPQSS